MTGVVEAASLALAVLPIVISVAEKFSSTARALKRYRHFSLEVGHLSKLVRLQRTIFQGEIRSLLASSVGWDRAEHLLHNADQSGWDDKGLEESFVASLGNTRDSFLELVQWINAELSEMEAKLNGFEEVAQLTKEGDMRKDRLWRHQIKEKSRFALSQSRLQESMNRLKELIENLRTLVSQRERSEQRRPLSRPSAQAQQVIQQFVLVQTASQNLYEALSTACTKHTQHQAHFSLQPIPVPGAQQVRFSVGFRHVLASTSGSKQTSWFTVESSVTPAAHACLASTEYKPLAVLGRTPSSPPPKRQPSKLRGKCVQFELSSPPRSRSPAVTCKAPETLSEPPLSDLCSHNQGAFRKRKETHAKELEAGLNDLEAASNKFYEDNKRLKRELANLTTENEILRATSSMGPVSRSVHGSQSARQDDEPTNPHFRMQGVSRLQLSSLYVPETVSKPPLTNLCSHSNFCNHLQNFLSRSAPRSECCIGYLEHSSKTKHLIYLKGQEPREDEVFNVPSKSLAQLLVQYQGSSDQTAGIAQYERLRLSRKLATAVLQFYSTPWLRNSWGSSDVLFQFQQPSSTGAIEDLKEPFVDVSVRDPTIATNGGQSTTCYPFAPNDFLFGLGVMLLELAYQKPLRSMQQPCDVANSHDERHTLFFTAKRLSRLVSAKSGSRYGEIVRKCLTCDFGRGDDLSQPALQEGVYREVVCELTELEELLRAMNLGS
ncbi:hypothetical protein GJ744_004413 [Endocarpon pusillum]|uniref:DUF7580 domain-containing protein n=1 Tax=Endocarpon pusillum TaxID=364733 RepID=A0A8H7ARM1_9EURO|nr:hypothetical protein GJ744_004413 [Endocarpon pusillum]